MLPVAVKPGNGATAVPGVCNSFISTLEGSYKSMQTALGAVAFKRGFCSVCSQTPDGSK